MGTHHYNSISDKRSAHCFQKARRQHASHKKERGGEGKRPEQLCGRFHYNPRANGGLSLVLLTDCDGWTHERTDTRCRVR
ncbi:hypothetical protein CEXT_740731 [Caerostris extrusa]|uniref:Uncharacterized protein n=1 Tax=Caerostris extrusa TaxID=172846 RepID=A0AAV4V601_CAEEX|nr:hypothetical protein CEXT_740731 [Caerostris extrusa]